MDGCGGGVGDVNVPCTWHKFDATQDYAVGCGVWGMMSTFLELAYMFDRIVQSNGFILFWKSLFTVHVLIFFLHIHQIPQRVIHLI